MKLIVLVLAVLGLVRRSRGQSTPTPATTPTFSIPPEPDPTLSMESYYAWANWAAAYSPWSLR